MFFKWLLVYLLLFYPVVAEACEAEPVETADPDSVSVEALSVEQEEEFSVETEPCCTNLPVMDDDGYIDIDDDSMLNLE